LAFQKEVETKGREMLEMTRSDAKNEDPKLQIYDL